MENKTLKELYREMNPDIYHYGVLGMHWGIRRFQPYSLIPRKSGEGGKEIGAAKKASKSSNATTAVKKAINKPVSAIQKKTRKQKSEEAKAEVERKVTTARQRQEELDKIVKSGDAKLVYEHRSELTNQQLEQAIARINTEQRVAQLVRQQNPTTLDKIKDLAGKVDDVNSITKTGINTAKNVTDIKKMTKDAKDALAKAKKQEISSEAMKEIIEKGSKPEDVIRLQSKLTKEDLQAATQRVSSLNADEQTIVNRDKRNRTEYTDRINWTQEEKQRRADQLQKNLEGLDAGKKTVDEDWGAKDLTPGRNTKKWNDYYVSEINKTTGKSVKKETQDLASGTRRAEKWTKDIDPGVSNDKFDKYFETEVTKLTGFDTKKNKKKK